MEVHHPHHPTHKKNWKEYITEFLMLFFAVTLGFFVENYREHYIEQQREKEFLQLIVQDVDMDMSSIDTNLYYRSIRASIAEDLTNIFLDKSYLKDTGPFYYQARRMNVRYYFERSDAGFQQLKNAGGLRLIHDQKIIKAIQKYEQLIATIDEFEDAEVTANVDYKNASTGVLDANVIVKMNAGPTSNYYSFIQPKNNPPLHSYDKDRLNTMMTMMHSIDRINYVIIYFENKLKEEAKKLKATISIQ
ncbi:MAG: hypothetical protein RI965_130 [Bacteroidota bacterium]|jgi:hypothetical protein